MSDFDARAHAHPTQHSFGEAFNLPVGTSDSAPGDVADPGVQDMPARADHVHGREAAPSLGRIVVPLTQFTACLATPVIAQPIGSNSAWLFDGTVREAIVAVVDIPNDWVTVNVSLRVFNPTANAGNVLWAYRIAANLDDGDVQGSLNSSLVTVIQAATTFGEIDVVPFATGASLASKFGKPNSLFISRNADQGTDTLDGFDMAFVCAVLDQAS